MRSMPHETSSYPMMIQRLLQKYPHAPLVQVEQLLNAQDFAEQKEKQEEYPIEGVALGVVTTPSDEVILTQRTKPFRGWGLPGGRVEQGEAFDAALMREVREECGVDVRINDLVLIEQKQFISPEQESRAIWLAVFRAQVLGDHVPYTTQEARREGLVISVFTLHQLPTDMVLNDRAKIEAYFHLPPAPLS